MANVTTLKRDNKIATSRGSNLHLATAAPSVRLDMKKMNAGESSHAAPRHPGHHRSASRDSIGHLGSFLMELEGGCADFDGASGDLASDDTGSSTGIAATAAAAGDGINRGGTLQRKQHCSSLINTPSGISVMQDKRGPHRLPLPVAPPTLLGGNTAMDQLNGPQWTKNCAALLNYHKYIEYKNFVMLIWSIIAVT